MSKKMWSRIFKTKSTNKTPGISKKSSIPSPPTVTGSAAENRLSYYEEFHNCCQQQPPAKAKASRKQAAPDGAVKTPSKFSKVVNTFTLKRSSKENQSNQLNTTTTTTNQIEGNSPTSGEKNYSENDENVGGPNMDKTATPTAAQASAQADNTIEGTEEPVSLELIPCPTCSRTFVPKTLEKHMRICEKMTVKKRKIFDSSRQRREGTELAAYPLPKNFGLPPAKAEKSLSPKPHQAPPPVLSPRRPSEEVAKPPVLAKAVTPAAARKMISPMPTSTNLMTSSTGHSSSAPKERTRAAVVPKRIQPPPAEPCPYCERCFGVKAYDRHVEWCKEKALIASIKQNSTNSQVAAKERLEARIKYRAPCLKTKRSVNRDKYSCLNDENGDPMHGSPEDAHPKVSAMTSSMTSSFMSDGSKPSTRLNPLKKAPTPPALASRLHPSSTPSLSEPTTGKRRNVCPPRTATKPTSVPKLDFIKSLSTNTLGSADGPAPMSDGDLEVLFQREFKSGPTRPLPLAKLNADMQAPKSDPKIMSKRKKVEAARAQPETLPKLEASALSGANNARRLVKERIEFFDSSSSSSSASCQAETVVSSQQVPACLPNHKSFILSGLSDKYDPFLSAKRQLEELCSPSSPTDSIFSQPSLTPVSKAAHKPATPATPITPNKMTTSLTSTSSLTNPRRALTTVKSNFRRTSSLRAPRRSPLPVPTRSIFFPTSQKQRPTIQRGLSDEGPISSNFLKPEEYDEMPVRSVCVNDFAITNTPRVIRRDSNAAANRRNLRLQLPSPGQSSKENTPTPPVGTGNNSLLKTDSLAVFLKYENEAKAVESPVINTKELKDKSNTLSKQNSAKSVAAADEQLRPTETPARSDNSNGGPGNLSAIKLEPISKPASAKQTASPQQSKRPTPPAVVSPLATKPVNLNLIFDARDRLPEVDRDYIDPKLINVCDNLPMELGSDLPLSSNSSSSTSTSEHGERADAETEKVDHAENSPHLSSSANSSPSPQTFKRAPSPAPQLKATPAANSCSNSNRNSSGDSRNLKRKMRPGRNQFLYDASPESEARENDADDERNNRSSCEPDIHQLHHRSLFSATATKSTTSTPNIPPFSPSTFDEFDFEEFLSSFDNDDDQFPSLFKDCREFLLNRTTLTNRSHTQTDNISSYRSSSGNNSTRKYEQEVEQNLNCAENKKRGEIFISIETDQNENDPHPKNDPLVAANPTAQIEEVDANDNKFRKIEDTDIDVDGDGEDDNEDDGRDGHDQRRGNGDDSDDHLRRRRINLLNDFPNVRLNNAKNLVQQMHEDFRELYTNSAADAEDQLNGNSVIQVTGSSLYPVDSDEISSIECYPVRRGGSGSVSGRGSSSCAAVQPKHSADSAYGSLSRQSPTADITPRYHSSLSNRARTPATPHDQMQQYQFQYPTPSPTQYKYSNLNKNETQKYHSRDFSIGSSSSGSDNSLPPIKASKNLPSLQDHQARATFHRNHPLSSAALENKISHSAQMSGMGSTNSSTNNLDPSSTSASPTATARPSKFCHECGTRFLLEQAKFCMDCGAALITKYNV